MTKNEYMKELAYRLRRLPKEDFDRAMDYFEEYFEEAGEENLQQAIQDLGAPKDAANELILNLAQEISQKEPQTIKHRLSAIWIGILALFAAPIALPLAFGGVCVILALLLSLVCVIFSIFLATVGTAAVGVAGLIGGLILLPGSFADGISTMGISLVFIGLGCLCSYYSLRLGKWIIAKLGKLPVKFTKGGRRNEME